MANTPSQTDRFSGANPEPRGWQEHLSAGKRAYEEARFREAEREYKAALQAAEAFGPKDPRFASTLNDLAEVYRADGRYNKAEPLFLQALALREETHGSESIQVAHTLNNLAALYAAQGRFAEAEKNYQRAIQIQENVLGSEDDSLGASLNNLALLYKQQNNFAAALPLFQRALNIWLKSLGAEHPHVATILNNLGAVCHAQGEFKEAESLFKQGLAIKEKALGSQHPEVATILSNLAELYSDQKRYAEARPLFERMLAIDETSWGPEHPEIASDLNQLARVCEAQGDYTRAEECYQRALEIREKAFGPDHAQVRKIRDKLAALYRLQSQSAVANFPPEPAASVQERREPEPEVAPAPEKIAPPKESVIIKPLLEQVELSDFPVESPRLAITEIPLESAPRAVEEGKRSGDSSEPAALPRAPQRAEEAQAKPLVEPHPVTRQGEKTGGHSPAQVEAAKSARRIILIPASQSDLRRPSAAQNLSELAERYAEEGRLAEAEKLYEGALAIEKSMSSQEASTGATLNNLGCVRKAEGQVEDAARLFQESLAIWLKTFGPRHVWVAAALNNLASLCLERQAYPEAEALYQQSLRICENAPQSDSSQRAVILGNLVELYSSQGRHREAAALIERLQRR